MKTAKFTTGELQIFTHIQEQCSSYSCKAAVLYFKRHRDERESTSCYVPKKEKAVEISLNGLY